MSLGGGEGRERPDDVWHRVVSLVQRHPLEAGLVGFVLVVGLWYLLVPSFRYVDPAYAVAGLLVLLATAAAVGLFRVRPDIALGLVWAVGAFQVVVGARLTPVQLLLVVVPYGCARHGERLTVWLSGASVLVGPLVALAARNSVFGSLSVSYLPGLSGLYTSGWGSTLIFAVTSYVAGVAVVGLPWLGGRLARSTQRARSSEESLDVAQEQAARATAVSEQAREIARLRDEQARLARDVHDVVGHSLAVILAQAESAQFLPDSDPAALKATMATIATSARSSLQDVRQVLGATQTVRPTGGLDSLVEGVRSSGHAVESTVVGTPAPLPPELDAVAFRVLQEMLTNALKHGRRDAPILVERHWPAGQWDHDLRIEVRNVEDDAEETQPLAAGTVPGGKGLDGMRRRLESVGGRLDVRRREEPDGATFTVTAWVPVRVTSRAEA